MNHFTSIPVASYVCCQSNRGHGSYKLMCFVVKPQPNGKRVMPHQSMISYLSYNETVSHEMAIERLSRMSLSNRTDTIHVYDTHVFNAEGLTIQFGKYKGSLLSDVFIEDPAYIRWMATTIKPTSFTNRCIQLQCQKWAQSNHGDPVLKSRHATRLIHS